MRIVVFVLFIVYSCAALNVQAQSRIIKVDIESIQYSDGTITMNVSMPKFKKRLKAVDAESRMRSDIVSKIIDEGVEKTPYNRRFDIDKAINLDEIVRLIGPDIQLYDLAMDKTMVYAICKFDIKHVERRLMDNGYLRKFGI